MVTIHLLILEPKKRKCVPASTFPPSVCHEVIAPDAMICVFLILSFKPTFFTFLFHPYQKALYSSSLLSAIKVVSSPYLRLLIFLPATFFPACNSSIPAFLMMYSAYKLNKQGFDNIQPYRTHFPILNQSVVPSLVLTVAS